MSYLANVGKEERVLLMNELVKALEFYANKDNWEKGTSVNYDWVTFIELDQGKKAREALREYRGVAQSG